VPHVLVEIWEGRTVGQKRRLAKAITDAMVEHADANADGLHVAIAEFSPESWARAGVLGSDRTDLVAPADRPPCVFGLGHLLLQVSDLEAAEGFYLGFLGLTVRKRERFRDGRPLVVTHEGLGLTDGRPEGQGPLEHFALRGRSIEQLAARARERGVPIVRGPERSGYGLSLYLADPDGNTVELYGDAARLEESER
jgi:phenylpyruvate tautomerase PptA (4-oxalocrotonate tautomerase family)/catechol 2,3-dioxygenase-like lactoylglutathione lyase family enzyme